MIEWLGAYYIESQFCEKAIPYFERATVIQSVVGYLYSSYSYSIFFSPVGGSSPSCWGGKPISGQGEARRAESGLGFHGKGHPASSPQAVGSESVSSPSGVLGEAAAAKRVSCILEAPDSPSGTYWGQVRGAWLPCPPLNPPMFSPNFDSST